MQMTNNLKTDPIHSVYMWTMTPKTVIQSVAVKHLAMKKLLEFYGNTELTISAW